MFNSLSVEGGILVESAENQWFVSCWAFSADFATNEKILHLPHAE